MASALYNMGNNLTNGQRLVEAKAFYMKACDIFKDILISLYKEKGKEIKT